MTRDELRKRIQHIADDPCVANHLIAPVLGRLLDIVDKLIEDAEDGADRLEALERENRATRIAEGLEEAEKPAAGVQTLPAALWKCSRCDAVEEKFYRTEGEWHNNCPHFPTGRWRRVDAEKPAGGARWEESLSARCLRCGAPDEHVLAMDFACKRCARAWTASQLGKPELVSFAAWVAANQERLAPEQAAREPDPHIIPLEPSTDTELTCFRCGDRETPIDREFTLMLDTLGGARERTTFGAHSWCVVRVAEPPAVPDSAADEAARTDLPKPTWCAECYRRSVIVDRSECREHPAPAPDGANRDATLRVANAVGESQMVADYLHEQHLKRAAAPDGAAAFNPDTHSAPDDPWCLECGHAQSDHPRGQCGGTTGEHFERCDCMRFRGPPAPDVGAAEARAKRPDVEGIREELKRRGGVYLSFPAEHVYSLCEYVVALEAKIKDLGEAAEGLDIALGKTDPKGALVVAAVQRIRAYLARTGAGDDNGDAVSK